MHGQEGFHVLDPGHGGSRSDLGDRKPGDGAGKAGRFPQGHSRGDGMGKTAVEGVAGARGIHDVIQLEGGDKFIFFRPFKQQAAPLAHGDDYGLDAHSLDGGGGLQGRIVVHNRNPGEVTRFGFVGGYIGDVLQDLLGEFLIGGGVQDDRNAMFLGDLYRGDNGFHAGFQLGQDDIRFADGVFGFIDVLPGELPAGAQGHDDHILAGLLHDDESSPRGFFGINGRIINVDVFRKESAFGHLAKIILPQLGYHIHRGSAAGSSHGLVSALAARAHAERTTQNGFAGHRHMRRAAHQVNDKTSDNCNHSFHILFFKIHSACMQKQENLLFAPE